MEDQLETVIRRAAVDDADAVARVHVASWREAYADHLPRTYLDGLEVADRARRWRDLLADHRGTTWVAEQEGEVVGFAHLAAARDEDADPGTLEIQSIYLMPAAWGHGAARELMRTMLATVGSAPVTLWVLGANDRARHFYRRHGFQPDGVERTEEIGGTTVLEVRYRRG